jgi:hypothetical protein
MMSMAIMPVRNTKDKFKRALLAGKQRPREDESLKALEPQTKKACTEDNSRNYTLPGMADYASSEGSLSD